MANSVEGRFPFLDRDVVEFAGQLPARHKLLGLDEKYLLKRAFARPGPGRDRPPAQAALPRAGRRELLRGRRARLVRRRHLRPEAVAAAGRVRARRRCDGLLAKCAAYRGRAMSNTDNMRVLRGRSRPSCCTTSSSAPTRREHPGSSARPDAAVDLVDRRRGVQHDAISLRTGRPRDRRGARGRSDRETILTLSGAQQAAGAPSSRCRAASTRASSRRSACAALGPERVFGLHMPESRVRRRDAGLQPEADRLAGHRLGPRGHLADPRGAAGCYRRRDDAIRRVVPGLRARATSRRSCCPASSTPTRSACTPWSCRRPTARRARTG